MKPTLDWDNSCSEPSLARGDGWNVSPIGVEDWEKVALTTTIYGEKAEREVTIHPTRGSQEQETITRTTLNCYKRSANVKKTHRCSRT
ncbi:hypothetical protein MHYP_G00280430 [Metynnis hypsauchen]